MEANKAYLKDILKICLTLENVFSISICRFVGPYTQNDFPVTKKLSERIYFEASVDTIDHRLTILARDCYATPNPETNSSPKYWIIQNG